MKILYIYNLKDWAIYNIGKLWFRHRKDIKVDFIKNIEIKNVDIFKDYDYIMFGFYKMWMPFKDIIPEEKVIVGVQDPSNVWGMTCRWKEEDPKWHVINNLKQCRMVFCDSKELVDMLFMYGVRSVQLPTASLLPLRDPSTIKTKRLKLISVFDNHRNKKKNREIMNDIAEECKKINIEFLIKAGRESSHILSPKEYMGLLDRYPVYVCLSIQEGGPIPALDSMARGGMVFSTMVGQIPEIVDPSRKNNGAFILADKDLFMARISQYPYTDMKAINEMRINSLEEYKRLRGKKVIDSFVNEFLEVIK